MGWGRFGVELGGMCVGGEEGVRRGGGGGRGREISTCGPFRHVAIIVMALRGRDGHRHILIY